MLPQTSANEKFFLIAVCSYFLQRYIKIQYAVIFLRIFKITKVSQVKIHKRDLT